MSFQQNVFQQNAFQVEIGGGLKRAALVMPTPRAAQIGSVDLLQNLLLTTLAAVASTPFVQRLDAPAPQARTEVRCEQVLNLPRLLLPDKLPIGDSRAVIVAEPGKPKYEIRFDHPPNLIRQPLPDYLPQGKQVSDSAPPVTKPVEVDRYPPLIRQPLPDYLPQGKQVSDSSPPVTKPVVIDVYPDLIGRTLPDFATIGAALSDSAPITKYALGTPLIPGQIVAPSAVVAALPQGEQQFDPAPVTKYAIQADNWPSRLTTGIPVAVATAPIGDQWFDSAPAVRYQPQVDAYPNATLYGSPGIPAWFDFDPAPAMSKYLPVFDPPNLLVTTLFAVPPQPPGSQWFASAPPPKIAVTVDIVRTDLVRGIPTVPPPPLPLSAQGQTVTQQMLKYEVWDLNLLWPNSQIPGIPPPVVPIGPPLQINLSLSLGRLGGNTY